MHVLIHIPKTAGSSVNKILAKHLGRGREHIQNIMNREDFNEQLKGLPWVSGHVPLSRLEGKISADLSPKYFTFFRDPTDQLISHLKWQFTIFDKGKKFFLSHPILNQIISLEAMDVDYTSTESIIKYIEKYHRLFLNFQSTFFLSGIPGKTTKEIVIDDAKRFSFIGTTGSLDQNLPLYLGARQGASPIRKNVNTKSYFDEGIFRGKTMQTFLKERNALDIFVYDIIKNEIEPSLMEQLTKQG